MTNLDAWFNQLKQKQLIKPEVEFPKLSNASPWYLRVFSGFCGWLAAWFLVGFIGLSFDSFFDNAAAMVIIGSLLIAGAFVIFRQKGNDFVEQLGLGVSIAGQLFIAFALFVDWPVNDAFPWLVLAILQSFLAVVMPNYLHRLLSAYFASVALAMLLSTLQLTSFYSAILLFGVALIWLNEYSFSRQVSGMQAIGYGLTVGLIQFKTSMLFSHTNTWVEEGLPTVNIWLDEGLNTLVLLFAIYMMLRRNKLVFAPADKLVASILLVLLCAANMFANGIVCGLAILLMGYATQNRALLVLGVIATLVNLSSYYYLLQYTLLNKSLVLLGTGVLSLLLALIWQQKSKEERR